MTALFSTTLRTREVEWILLPGMWDQRGLHCKLSAFAPPRDKNRRTADTLIIVIISQDWQAQTNVFPRGRQFIVRFFFIYFLQFFHFFFFLFIRKQAKHRVRLFPWAWALCKSLLCFALCRPICEYYVRAAIWRVTLPGSTCSQPNLSTASCVMTGESPGNSMPGLATLEHHSRKSCHVCTLPDTHLHIRGFTL